VLTRPSIEKARQLSETEYAEKLEIFEELLPRLAPYIKAQAAQRAAKLPNSVLGEEDLISIGNIQTWVAVITWEPEKGASLENWARRRIWTNMNVVMGNLYQLKRVPRGPSADGTTEVTLRPTSLFAENKVGNVMGEYIEDRSQQDPIGELVADEMYTRTRQKLLSQNNRVAAAVLRLMEYPDRELLQLCEENARRSRRKIRLTNKSLAQRLGVTTSRIADAKADIRVMFKEYSKID